MQAKEFYEIGIKAYNGDKDAKRAFFGKLAPLVISAAKSYGVLPSFIMAKAVIESGYMTDEWNKTAEALSGKKLKSKAQHYNNIFSMNCFADNQKYLEYLPDPEWINYRDTFGDWGPHGNDEMSLTFKFEPWKAYRSVEDAVEDWCANIRYQASAHGHSWNPTDLTAQLLATESYTPEGSADGVRSGLHYGWQEQILKLYEAFELWKYDEEVEAKVSKVEMTTKNLDAHIKKAYEYARTNCHYAPCFGMPPMSDGAADCVGLVFRALYTMGYMKPANIDQIGDLCKAAGMRMSTDVDDVWKHHGVVCMQGNHLYNTQHVTHVYYSLGGTGLNSIQKYDLGSNRRIKEDEQPYTSVPVNEWPDKYHFFMFFYPEERPEKLEDVPTFLVSGGVDAAVTKNTGLYAGPGTAWRKKGSLKAGEIVTAYQSVSNDKGNLFRIVRTAGDTIGYAYSSSVRPCSFKAYNGVVKGTDGSLSLRVGAGTGCCKVADIPEGEAVRVDGKATADDGGKWLHIKAGKLRGYVAAKYVKKK